MKLLMSILTLTYLSTAGAQYVPVKSPKCGPRVSIRAPKNGAGVFFNESCNIAFVLPPAYGSVDVVGNPTPTTTVRFCPLVNSRIQTALALQKRVDDLIVQLKPREPNCDPDDPFCPRPPRNGDENYKKIADAIAEVTIQQNAIIDSLKLFSEMSAGELQIVFNANHAKLVEEYKSLNPRMTFVPLTIRSAALTIARRGIGKAETLPAVLSSSIHGIQMRDSSLTGEPLPDPNGNETKRYSNEESKDVVFSSAMSGNINLSLFGACPFYDMDKEQLKSNLSSKDFTAYLVANATYAFDLQSYAKYKASYNLANLVRRMQKSTTHGGLFSSSSAVEIINEKNSSDWFQFESDEDDSEFQIGVKSQDVKADLIDRVIAQIGYVAIDGSGRIPDPAAPPVRGATVAANELQKCLHIYCQAVAIGLRVLDSIFGSSEATQNFISRSNYTATDIVDSKRMLRYRGSFTFAPEVVQ